MTYVPLQYESRIQNIKPFLHCRLDPRRLACVPFSVFLAARLGHILRRSYPHRVGRGEGHFEFFLFFEREAWWKE